MVALDLRAVSQPLGIMRIMAIFLACMSLSLAASAGHHNSPYWAWCMFTWCFCFFITLLILILEFTTVSSKLPFPWIDFTTAFAMLACLMCLSASIIYPTFFTCKTCHREIGASVVSWVCLAVYVGEVVFTRLRPSGEHIGFLSTLPGIMKMLETFIACLIFTSLEPRQYSGSPVLQWSVAVFCLCFIFNMLIILLTLTQLSSYSPVPFDKIVIVYNVLAALMYATAMVIWPLYGFKTKVLPDTRDKQVVVTFLAVFNFIVYTLDSAYSIFLVFCIRSQ